METTNTEVALDQVNRDAIDFAMVSGAFRIGDRKDVREVTQLHMEALHLLVKPELADSPTWNLRDLQGRTVDLGPSETETAGLASAVMAFADLVPGDGDCRGYVRCAQFRDFRARRDVWRGTMSLLSPMPSFNLATVPSMVAMRLVHIAGYRLVSLPFADAFRLGALVSKGRAAGAAGEINRQFTYDTVIPAYTYRADPGVPAADLHTLGTRLLLVAGDQVHPATVEHVLDAVFTSRFARVANPPLDPSVLHVAPQFVQHAGAVRYMHRGEPFITKDSVSQLATTYSLLSALVGSSLLVWQWWRRRTQDWREETFGNLILRIANIEHRGAELELAAGLEIEPLISLQKDLLQLKSEALERFAAGELGDHTTLSGLLNLVNAARDHIGDLILHCRENLEEQAQAEGRSAEALWTEATEVVADPSLIPQEPDKD